jgi:hypothetical protein
MPGIGAPAGAFSVGAKAVAQVPSLLADAVQMMRANPEAGLLATIGGINRTVDPRVVSTDVPSVKSQSAPVPQIAEPKSTYEQTENLWFPGETKVVNEQGQPKIVYSGQPKGRTDFEGVDRSEIGGVGFFTDSPDVASLYAGVAESERKGLTNYSTGRDGEVGSYLLRIEKPWDPDSISKNEKNKWLHAAAREEMGYNYDTASNNDRLNAGWDYFVSKYGLPERVAEGDMSLDEWRKYNDFYDYINEVIAPRIPGQGYTSEFIGKTKHGSLLLLEPDLFKGIKERNGYDGIIYHDPEHPGTNTLIPFSAEQIKIINNK